MTTLTLTPDHPLTLTDFEAASIGQYGVDVAPAGWATLARAHEYLERLIAERRRVYGVTTGYGPLAVHYVDPARSAELQRNLVYHLASGTGEPLARPVARGIMIARAQNAIAGHSGLRPASMQLLLDCLNRDLVPAIPERGTVGASGDLTPLAHMTLALMGEGEFLVNGDRRPSGPILRQHGLTPLDPNGKDALALVNGTSAMTAIAALNACEAQRALDLCTRLTLLFAELQGGHREPYAPGLTAVRPHAGQRTIQEQLLALAADSRRLVPQPEHPEPLPDTASIDGTWANQPLPQPTYATRCAPQLLGAVQDVITFHNNVVVQELNAVTDNPLLFPDEDQVIHGGNFYGQHVAFAADALNNAVIKMAIHAERKIAQITDPRRNNGLPAFLQGRSTGLHSGFMGAQVTATALVAEMRSDAMPASIQSISTNADNQDVVTMGTIAARNSRRSLDRLYEVLAIESMVLAQALELEGGFKTNSGFCSASVETARRVRAVSPFLDQDRPLSRDIERLAKTWRHPAPTPQSTQSNWRLSV